MRHHNRARLIDIADNKLNPKEKLVVGKDGRLVSSRKPLDVSDVKNETKNSKSNLNDESTIDVVEEVKSSVSENIEQIVAEQEIKEVTEKKTKKKPFGRT